MAAGTGGIRFETDERYCTGVREAGRQAGWCRWWWWVIATRPLKVMARTSYSVCVSVYLVATTLGWARRTKQPGRGTPQASSRQMQIVLGRQTESRGKGMDSHYIQTGRKWVNTVAERQTVGVCLCVQQQQRQTDKKHKKIGNTRHRLTSNNIDVKYVNNENTHKW